LIAYPDLKPSELKLCSYLRLNLSTKELAEILNKSVRTIENARFSIRKKMGLGPEDNLVGKLIALESTTSSVMDKS
jgi:DNA-binding CsgD family transcriptional regulator